MAGNILLVDTNVISYVFKKDTRAALYEPVLDGKLLMMAAQTSPNGTDADRQQLAKEAQHCLRTFLKSMANRSD